LRTKGAVDRQGHKTGESSKGLAEEVNPCGPLQKKNYPPTGKKVALRGVREGKTSYPSTSNKKVNQGIKPITGQVRERLRIKNGCSVGEEKKAKTEGFGESRDTRQKDRGRGTQWVSTRKAKKKSEAPSNPHRKRGRAAERGERTQGRETKA